MAKKIIIDTDPATGYPLRDVDDGLAILYLLAFPEEFEVLGITTVFGNTSVKRTTVKAQEILTVSGIKGIGVYKGASCARERGKESEASRYLIDAVSMNPGEITILALAPLTNISTAGLLDPNFYSKLESLIIMGGSIYESQERKAFPQLEFNFARDKTSAGQVLKSQCKKILITSELCRQVIFTRRELSSLYLMENRVSTYLARRIEPWLKLNQVLPILPWKGGFVPWDLVAAVFLRKPELFGQKIVSKVKLIDGILSPGTIEIESGQNENQVEIPQVLDSTEVLIDFLRAMKQYRQN